MKQAVDVPVIALAQRLPALGGWLEYAKLIEQAGADALELNVYYARHRPERVRRRRSSSAPSRWCRPCARRSASRWPSSSRPSTPRSPTSPRSSTRRAPTGSCCSTASTSPTSTSRSWRCGAACTCRARRSCCCGCAGSRSCRPKLKASLAVTGGVHTVIDAVKAIMAGAHAVQLVSALLKHGPQYLATLRAGARAVARGARVRVAAPDAGQHEPRGLPRPRGLRAAPTTCWCCRAGGRRSPGGGTGVRSRALPGERQPVHEHADRLARLRRHEQQEALPVSRYRKRRTRLLGELRVEEPLGRARLEAGAVGSSPCTEWIPVPVP